MIDPRDNKEYKTVVIGEQIWMAENLNYYNLTITPSLENTSGCPYDNPDYCNVAGRLYTWAAAIDSAKLETDPENSIVCRYGKTCNLPEKVQGICPDGWHLPSYSEWSTLLDFIRNNETEYISETHKLKSKSGWAESTEERCPMFTYGYSGNGDDSYGFSAIPNGSNNAFWGVGFDNSSETAYAYAVDKPYYEISSSTIGLNRIAKTQYSSIRCIKDEESSGN